jgi:hypothetical protein
MILEFNAGTFTKTNEMLTSTVYKYVSEHYLMSEESMVENPWCKHWTAVNKHSTWPISESQSFTLNSSHDNISIEEY